jgi:TRAP-type transport system small permease protein
MRARVEKLRGVVDRALNALAVVLFLMVFAVVLLQVFMRYVLNSPLVWSEELARYAFVWVSFLGWVLATRSGTHIRIGAFVDMMPATARRTIRWFNALLVILFAVVLAWYGGRMVLKNTDVPTITLFFSYAMVYAAVPFSCALIVFYTLVRILAGHEETGGTVS